MIDSDAVEKLNFSTRIRLLREERGWSKKDIERRSGVPTSTYTNYEECGSLPGLTNLKRLAKLFGVSLDYLGGMDDK